MSHEHLQWRTQWVVRVGLGLPKILAQKLFKSSKQNPNLAQQLTQPINPSPLHQSISLSPNPWLPHSRSPPRDPTQSAAATHRPPGPASRRSTPPGAATLDLPPPAAWHCARRARARRLSRPASRRHRAWAHGRAPRAAARAQPRKVWPAHHRLPLSGSGGPSRAASSGPPLTSLTGKFIFSET